MLKALKVSSLLICSVTGLESIGITKRQKEIFTASNTN